MSSPAIIDEALWEALRGDTDRLNRTLFLEPHQNFPRQWVVNSFDPTYRQRLDGAISKYDSVPYIKFDKFKDAALAAGYEIVFMGDPFEMETWLLHLQGHPGVKINSGMEGRTNRDGEKIVLIDGFLPFQAVGVQFQKTCERICWLQWSTGTGKTIGAEGTILWRKERGFGPEGKSGFDVCFIFAKPNNLVGTMRKLKAHTGIDGIILSGTPKRRLRRFEEIAKMMDAGEQPVVILTYEKFREDKEFMKLLVEDHYVLNIADEAPTKMRTRGTQIYRSANEVLYTSFMVTTKVDKKTKKLKQTKIYYPKVGKERAKQMFTVVTSATPVYNSPEDTFSVVRVFDPTIFGSVSKFETDHVARKDRWGNITTWKNLDLMGEKLAHVTYQVDKTDPDIAVMFPEKLPPELVEIELHSEDQKLYDKLVDEYKKLKDDELSMLSRTELLAAINCLQMLINNPRGVLQSAIAREEYEEELTAFEKDLDVNQGIHRGTPKFNELVADFAKKNKRGSRVAMKFRWLIGDDSKFTDRNPDGSIRCAKLEQLIEDVQKNDSKVIAFSRFNEQNLPFIAEALDDCGVTYVLFRGGMSDKKRQDAIDAFKGDPAIKLFLSSDAGSDSIDLEEANLTINYDLNWTDAGLTQRVNRQDRIISDHPFVRQRDYETPDSVEQRTREIVVTKRGYSDQIYKGTIAEQSADVRSFSKKGLIYALTGREVEVND